MQRRLFCVQRHKCLFVVPRPLFQKVLALFCHVRLFFVNEKLKTTSLSGSDKVDESTQNESYLITADEM